MTNAGRDYTASERRLLARHFSQVDPSPHADVFVVRNLPGEVAATLNGVYSRSPLSMRDNFLERLKKGLEVAGRDFDATVEANDAPSTDVLSELMADRSGQFLKTYAIDHGHNWLREGFRSCTSVSNACRDWCHASSSANAAAASRNPRRATSRSRPRTIGAIPMSSQRAAPCCLPTTRSCG